MLARAGSGLFSQKPGWIYKSTLYAGSERHTVHTQPQVDEKTEMGTLSAALMLLIFLKGAIILLQSSLIATNGVIQKKLLGRSHVL